MTKTICLWLICLPLILSAQQQPALLGEWDLFGISAQNVGLPKLQGSVRLFFYSDNQLILKNVHGGSSKIQEGKWKVDSAQVLHLNTESYNLKWKISLIDQANMVLRDVEDNAHISFNKVKETEKKAALQSKIEGNWHLAEAGGKELFITDAATPTIQLQSDGTLIGKGWQHFQTGIWALSPDQHFLKLAQKDSSVQLYELLHVSDNALLINDMGINYIFWKTENKEELLRNAGKRILGTWDASSPPAPILKARLVFRKDGTLEGISNLNSEVCRWQLSNDNKTLEFLPYMENSEDRAHSLRLRFLDKATILISDADMSVLFIKQQN